MSNKKRVSKIQMHHGGLAPLLAVALLFVLRIPCAGMHFVETQYPVGNGPMGVTIGDFNRDGHPDIAIVNARFSSDSGNVSFVFSDGHGGFLSPIPYNVGPNPLQATAADFDHDGNLDLAVATENGIAILFGTGGGTPAPAEAMGTHQPRTRAARHGPARNPAAGPPTDL